MFETLVAKQDPYVPKVDEVKDRVREEVVKQKARDLSKQKAAELAAKLKSAPDFEKAAKAAGRRGEDDRADHARTRRFPTSASRRRSRTRRSSCAVGAVSDPIPTDNGTAVIKVLEKKAVTPEEWTSSKDRFREELLADRRNRFFSAYMVKAKQKMKIEVNREVAAARVVVTTKLTKTRTARNSRSRS